MFNHLLPPQYKSEVAKWVSEDCPNIDIGGFVVGEKFEEAHLYCKESAILAGVPFAQAVFDYLGLQTTWLFEEGAFIDSSKGRVVVAVVKGKCREILLAERTALNILSRASGVATLAKESVDIAKATKWHGWVAGTRKTTPGILHDTIHIC